jgi:RNA polymerase-associated protein CTR9
MGLCYLKLNLDEIASRCFERVLEMDPDHLDSRIALAITKLNSHDEDSIVSGMLSMKEVYQLTNKSHPLVLLHLANHFFFKKEYQKAEMLITKAINQTQMDDIKAEANLLLGRIYHTQVITVALHNQEQL